MKPLTYRFASIAGLALASVALATAPGASGQIRATLTGDGFRLIGEAGQAPSTAILTGDGLTLVASIAHRGPTADVAEPFGSLDVADKTRFMSLFAEQNPAADLAEPKGVVDSNDLSEFVRRYETGQP